MLEEKPKNVQKHLSTKRKEVNKMPGGDGTGPMGLGAGTGRGMGYCEGFAVPGYANAGFGMGRGRGFRRMYYAPGVLAGAKYARYPNTRVFYSGMNADPAADEKEALKNEADYLEKQLTVLRERLKAFEETE